MTLSLPPSDPRSEVIWRHLEDLGDADQSAELRRLICLALEHGPRLVRMEALLEQLAAGGLVAAPAADAELPPPPPTADEIALLLSHEGDL